MLGRTPPIGVESASAFAEPNMKTRARALRMMKRSTVRYEYLPNSGHVFAFGTQVWPSEDLLQTQGGKCQ